MSTERFVRRLIPIQNTNTNEHADRHDEQQTLR